MGAFLAVSALFIVSPGPDMALVTRNALRRGRAAALLTALGVGAGITVWVVVSVLGAGALLQAWPAAFTALQLLGSAYLVYLGAQAWRTLSRARLDEDAAGPRERTSFREGLANNLLNPQAAAFFTSFLPQFVEARDSPLARSLLLGALFATMVVLWLVGCGVVVTWAGDVLGRPSIRIVLDRLTGSALIAFGLGLALSRLR